MSSESVWSESTPFSWTDIFLILEPHREKTKNMDSGQV